MIAHSADMRVPLVNDHGEHAPPASIGPQAWSPVSSSAQHPLLHSELCEQAKAQDPPTQRCPEQQSPLTLQTTPAQSTVEQKLGAEQTAALALPNLEQHPL
jgi:hypothetical protein